MVAKGSPGSREDTIEAHFDYSDWRKYTAMGSSLAKKHVEAIEDAVKHEDIYTAFKEKLEPENVSAWIAMAVAYEKDPKQPDPYFRVSKGLSEADIKLQLAEEDDSAPDGVVAVGQAITVSAVLIELLELEDQQFCLRYMTVSRNTAHQNTEIVKKRTALRRRLTAIRDIQSIYMPCVPRLVAAALHASSDSPSSPNAQLPEHQPLFLLHQLSPEDLDLCVPGLADMETRLREAQMHDSLDKLRCQLHVKSRMMMFKTRYVRHQGANTKMRRRLDVNDARIIVLAEKYQAA
ncbi:hypothetical protein PsYK624_167160 [Phanerochaete sordida]|uniref:Uncharacterized protein n=1 Tax=Phanerochaete sordida TaxID=48140 RepID=A0A9P3GRB2_9APHY|nr:hypothetical protein PsYK624_167160 [Phanerochaete sordida]